MASSAAAPKTEFERQRSELLQEIAESFEHVLANINKLNRNLEAVITVGNEFSSVEALWSTFENVMGKPAGTATGTETEAATAEGEGQPQKQQQQQQQQQQRNNQEHGNEMEEEEL